MNCQICDNKFNKSTIKPIICNVCDEKACRTCYETYLLDKDNAKCMFPNCNKSFDDKFLSNNFTSVFLNKEYKIHKANILFDIEKSLLPSTQIILESKHQSNLLTNQLDDINSRIDRLLAEKKIIENNIFYKGQATAALITRITNGEHLTEEDLIDRRWTSASASASAPVIEEKESRFIRACPSNDCRGYLTSKWVCGLCSTSVCKKCNEIKLENHECIEENIASAKLINGDSKPCPTCHSLIYRIDGCNQMWCVQCKTAFNWKTGEMEKHVHNPHYFDFIRAGGIINNNNNNINNNNNGCISLIDASVNLRRKIYELCNMGDNNLNEFRAFRNLRLSDVWQRWIIDKYDADGHYITDCYEKNKLVHVFIDNSLCYYNKLIV